MGVGGLCLPPIGAYRAYDRRKIQNIDLDIDSNTPYNKDRAKQTFLKKEQKMSHGIISELPAIYNQILEGETVDIGVFKVKEDFIYTGTKNKDGSPIMDRVISMVYFDEDDEDCPSTESFDGTFESFLAAIVAHDALEMYDMEEYTEE
jgi:hypothetical protein